MLTIISIIVLDVGLTVIDNDYNNLIDTLYENNITVEGFEQEFEDRKVQDYIKQLRGNKDGFIWNKTKTVRK